MCRNKKYRLLTLQELVEEKTQFMTVVHPVGNDGSVDHSVCVVDDLVFDSRFSFALKLLPVTFDFICGLCKLDRIGEVYRFSRPWNMKKKEQAKVVDKPIKSKAVKTNQKSGGGFFIIILILMVHFC